MTGAVIGAVIATALLALDTSVSYPAIVLTAILFWIVLRLMWGPQ